MAATYAAARQEFLAPAQVEITSTALEPEVLAFHARTAGPSWLNRDGVAHTVSFENGRCSFTIEPGARAACSDAFWMFVGTYRYRVSGIAPVGVVRVDPARRTISITASKNVLRGFVRAETGPLGSPSPDRVVTIFARRKSGAFVRVGRARTAETKQGMAWRFVVHPRRTTTYQARAWGQPPGGTVWQRASSRLVTVRVR
jgi:hypothetical protein